MGHGRTTDLENATVAQLLLNRLFSDGEADKAIGDELVRGSFTEVTPFCASSQDTIEWHSDPPELGGQVQQLPELSIPADELKVFVEDA